MWLIDEGFFDVKTKELLFSVGSTSHIHTGIVKWQQKIAFYIAFDLIACYVASHVASLVASRHVVFLVASSLCSSSPLRSHKKRDDSQDIINRTCHCHYQNTWKWLNENVFLMCFVIVDIKVNRNEKWRNKQVNGNVFILFVFVSLVLFCFVLNIFAFISVHSDSRQCE